MSRLELRLLGVPQVLLDGRECAFRTKKTLALLVFLAAEGGMHRRDKLAEVLWPTSTSRRGRTVLRSALSGIRRVGLREGTVNSEDGFLKIDGDLIGVRAGPELALDLDILREASAASQSSRPDDGQDGDLVSTLRNADAAYRGRFLEGFELADAPEFGLWAETQRGHWLARIGEVLRRLSDVEAEAGQLAAAAATAERWVDLSPAEEAARVRLMEARSAAGDPQGALAAYEEYRSVLQNLGLAPGPETEALAASLQSRVARVRVEEQSPAPGLSLTPFVGRRAKFETLVGEYRAARSGSVRSVIVVGEAGIGKTRLVEEFLSWAVSRGADVLSGSTLGDDTRLPYGALVDALRFRLERERAPDDLLEDRWLAELSRLLPELRDRYPDLPPPTADETSALALLLEALARLGAALAGVSPHQRGDGVGATAEPLVLFLDDLQWADGATLYALRYCCRSWARDGIPLLLLTAAREEDLAKYDIGAWLLSLEREVPLKRLTLSPMGDGDVLSLLRLLAGTASPGDNGDFARTEPLGRWLWQESDGLPLFLAQILGVLLERGVLVERAGREGRREVVLSEENFDEEGLRGLVPVGLRELIRDKLRPLSDAAVAVLTAGAVLGRGFGFGTLLGVARVGETEGLRALDELMAARLLEEVGTPSGGDPGGVYSFAHDKIREVVYTEAGEARRTVFHRRALEYLEGQGAPAAELARHALAAGLREKTFRCFLAAAEQAMAVFAARDAVGYYEQARDLLKDPTPQTKAAYGDADRLRLYGGLGRASALIYDWERAQKAYEKMLAQARESGDRQAEWEALYGLATLGGGFTVGPEDTEVLRGVTRREGSETRSGAAGEAPERTRTDTVYDPGTTRQHAEGALHLAHELGREDLIRRSEYDLGIACALSGMWEESTAHMEQARSLCAVTGDREMEAYCLLWLNWGGSLLVSPARAWRSYGKAAAEILDALDTGYGRAALGLLSPWLASAGEFDGAIFRASRGYETARSGDYRLYAYMSLWGLGDTYREMLALQEARSAYSKMLDWMTFPKGRSIAYGKLCSVAALMGEWEQAHEYALEAVEYPEHYFRDAIDRHHCIEALLRGGGTELVREGLRSVEDGARRQRGYYRLAYLRSSAVLARWKEDMGRTLSCLRQALDLAERLEVPGESWQVAVTLGEVHEERGEPGRSEQAFARAAALIRRLAAKVSDGDLREGYLSAPQTSRVLERARTR